MKNKRVAVTLLAALAAGYTIWEMVGFIKQRKNRPETWETVKAQKKWTDAEKRIMAARIIKSSKHLSQTDSATAWNVANCNVEKITAKYSFAEVMAMEGKNKTELEPLFEELVKECMTKFYKFPTTTSDSVMKEK